MLRSNRFGRGYLQGVPAVRETVLHLIDGLRQEHLPNGEESQLRGDRVRGNRLLRAHFAERGQLRCVSSLGERILHGVLWLRQRNVRDS